MKRIYAQADRYALILLAASFALVLSVYFSFQKVVVPRIFSSALGGAGGECVQPNAATAQKVNPNKLLFISCGGFLD